MPGIQQSRELETGLVFNWDRMLGQIRLFDSNDETQTGKQSKSQASLCELQIPPPLTPYPLPTAIRPHWNLLAGRQQESGGLVPCPSPALLATYELQCW